VPKTVNNHLGFGRGFWRQKTSVFGANTLSLRKRYVLYMKKYEFKSWFIWLGALFLSWLGLAGLADNIVEWREWFDIGIMEHWRIVKLWLTETLLFWFPYSVPSWVVDYLLLGCVFIRPYLLNTTQKSAERAGEKMREQKVASYTVTHQSGIPFLWVIPSLLFWPVVLFDEIKDICFNHFSGTKSPQSETLFKMVLISVVSFVPVLFVATDLIGTLGL
jgi:hypothetical protein